MSTGGVVGAGRGVVGGGGGAPGGGMALDVDGKWDADSKVIKDLANGVAAGDAVNKGQLDLVAGLQNYTSISALKAASVPANGTVADVRGYYTTGDGGGGFFRYDSASAATDNGGTIIAPNVGSGRWLRYTESSILAENFGARASGDTTHAAANTAALQAAINFASANRLTLKSAHRGLSYVINAPLDLPANTQNWGIDFSDAIIQQHTDDTAILRFQSNDSADMWFRIRIAGIHFSWTNLQPVANKQALAFALDPVVNAGTGIIGCIFEKIYVRRGYCGWGYTTNLRFLSFWGCRFDDWEFAADVSGRAFSSRCAVGLGMPNNSFRHWYVNGFTMLESPLMDMPFQVALQIDSFECNRLQGMSLISLPGLQGGHIGNVRVEFGEITTNFRGIVDISLTTGLRIENIEIVSFTFNSGGGTSNYIVRDTGSSSVARKVHIGNITVKNLTVTSGTCYLVGNSASNTLYDIDDFNVTGTSSGTIKPMEDFGQTPYHVVFNLNNGIMTSDLGDNNVTLYVKDNTNGTTPQHLLFNTPLTANRTITLPGGNFGTMPNNEYRVTRTAAATGASTLDVGGLKTLAAGQWCVIKKQAGTWRLVQFGSL